MNKNREGRCDKGHIVQKEGCIICKNARKELERIIGEVLNQNLYEVDGETLKVNVLPTEEIIEQQVSAILSAGYVKLSGRELPCKHLTFKTFNGKITELFIDGDEFVKLSDMNKKIEQALGYTLCMDCGETIKTTEQSKHLKECKRKDLEKIGE